MLQITKILSKLKWITTWTPCHTICPEDIPWSQGKKETRWLHAYTGKRSCNMSRYESNTQSWGHTVSWGQTPSLTLKKTTEAGWGTLTWDTETGWYDVFRDHNAVIKVHSGAKASPNLTQLKNYFRTTLIQNVFSVQRDDTTTPPKHTGAVHPEVAWLQHNLIRVSDQSE